LMTLQHSSAILQTLQHQLIFHEKEQRMTTEYVGSMLSTKAEQVDKTSSK